MPALAATLALALAAVQPVETPAQVVALCEAVSALPDGASTGEHRVVLSPDGLILAPDSEGPLLALSDRAHLSGAAGLLHVWIPGEAPLAAHADAGVIARARDAARRRALTIALTFVARGAAGDDTGCVHPNGARAYTLRVEPVGWDYLDGDAVVAHGGVAAGGASPEAPRDGRPAVEVGAVSGDAGEEVRSAILARRGELAACYRAALRRDASLDGALVAEVDLGRAADPRAVRIAIDAVQDDALAACVLAAVGAARFPRGRQGLAEVPIRFVLEPATADEGATRADPASGDGAARRNEGAVRRSARRPSR